MENSVEFHNIYSSYDIRMMTLRKMGYVRHVVCTPQVRNAYTILMGKNHSEAKPTCMNIIIIDLN
jgi:hypothetical protein